MDTARSRNGVPIRLPVEHLLALVPQLAAIPSKRMWIAYDEGADLLYVNFKKPSHADDSELTDDDIIIRYEGEQVVGMTILNVSLRRGSSTTVSSHSQCKDDQE